MKKFIALLISAIIMVSCMVPAFAAEAGNASKAEPLAEENDQEDSNGFSFDLSTILNSDIVQGIMSSDGFADITALVIDIMAKMDKDAIKQMGKEQVQKVVQSTFDTIASAIMLMNKNKDLVITYNPVDVIDNLFGTNVGSLTTKPSENTPSDDGELDIGPGDVDGDGKITAADARLILRRAAQLIKFTVEQDARADVDKDGKITAADARIVLRASAGLITL